MPKRDGGADNAAVTPVFPRELGFSETLVTIEHTKKELVLSVLEAHFGSVTRSVAKFLMNTANVTLQYLHQYFNSGLVPSDYRLSRRQVGSVLFILEKHGLLTVERRRLHPM